MNGTGAGCGASASNETQGASRGPQAIRTLCPFSKLAIRSVPTERRAWRSVDTEPFSLNSDSDDLTILTTSVSVGHFTGMSVGSFEHTALLPSFGKVGMPLFLPCRTGRFTFTGSETTRQKQTAPGHR